MIKKPDYIAQGDNGLTDGELNSWYMNHSRRAISDGCKRTHLSVMYLFEAWQDEDLKDADMGEPRVGAACGGWRRATQLDVALSKRWARQSGGASHWHLLQAGGAS